MLSSILRSCHSQSLAALLSASQGGDLRGQRVNILFVPDSEGVPREVHRAVLVVRPVVGGGVMNDSTLAGFIRQVTSSVADDLGLLFALFHHALSETLHGHRADFVAEHTRGTGDFELRFCRIDRSAGSRAHGRNHTAAACVDTSLGGILFSGVSGIGKSTQANLWCKYRGAKQINGDRPILSKENGGWTAWGSPYAGSSNVHVNDSCDIAAIVLLKQAERCAIRKLSTAEAFRGVWAGLTVRTWDAAFVERASELTIELATGLPVYEFCCTPDEEAVRFLEEELRKDNNK